MPEHFVVGFVREYFLYNTKLNAMSLILSGDFVIAIFHDRLNVMIRAFGDILEVQNIMSPHMWPVVRCESAAS